LGDISYFDIYGKAHNKIFSFVFVGSGSNSEDLWEGYPITNFTDESP
jgi:hypothetical protein